MSFGTDKSRLEKIEYIENVLNTHPNKNGLDKIKDALILITNSVRFMPYWDPTNSYHIIGLIEMMNYINSINPNEKIMIEIGTFLGESTAIFLAYENIKKIFCIDGYYGGSEKIKYLCKKRLQEFIDTERCSLIEKNSKECFHEFPENYIDLTYIDGDHRYEGVYIDIENSYKIIKPKGFVCGHDWVYYTDDIKNAVNDFMFKNKIPSESLKIFRDGSWCFQKI
jgi:hypothetical protein